MIINLQENLNNLNKALKKKEEDIDKMNKEYSIKEKKLIEFFQNAIKIKLVFQEMKFFSQTNLEHLLFLV